MSSNMSLYRNGYRVATYLYPDFRYAMLRKVWPPGVFSHLSGAVAAAAGVIVLEHLM